MATKKTKRVAQTARSEQKVLSMFNGSADERLFAMASVLLGRAEVAARMGKSYGTDRDIYTALGYTKNPTWADYYARYERQDVAKRVVEAPVDATWRGYPEVIETEGSETNFENGYKALVDDLNVYHYLSRADKIAGVGEYGVLLLGFDDSADLSEPVESARQLLYLQPYSQNSASIKSYIKDPKDRRYGMPELYEINFSNADKTGRSSQRVHHSRVIHIAEGLFEDNVLGTPRLRPVLNRLQDLELISGGSAEMFWRGGFPGYGFKNDPEASSGTQDLDALKDEIEEYMHGLKRYLRLQNMSVENLAVQIADPSNHVEVVISLISAATGIPKRILMGSERGELSSTQDKENWADRIQERRDEFAEPLILRQFVDTMVDVGVLPPPGGDGYEVKWPDAHAVSEMDMAKVAEIKAKALAAYTNAVGADTILPPEVFLKRFMGFTADEVDEIEKLVEKMKREEQAEVDQGAQPPQPPGVPQPPQPPGAPGQTPQTPQNPEEE